jgi:hypothetical protein
MVTPPGTARGAGEDPPSSPPPSPVPRQLNDLLIIRLAWMGKLDGRTHPSFAVHEIHPEPGWPVGRKGLLIHSLWKQLAKPISDGILIMDGDVVIDPADFGAMAYAAGCEPEAVHVAPVRLWPHATGLPGWVWAHRRPLPLTMPDDEAMAAWQEDIDDPVMFSFNFTYLPRRLVEGAVKSGLKTWTYPNVDRRMWETARDLGIPVRVVRNGCHPRHTNY